MNDKEIIETYTRLPYNIVIGDDALITQQQVIITLILLNKGYKDAIPFNISMILDLLNIKKTSTNTITNIINNLQELEEYNLLTYYDTTTLTNKINIKEANNNKIIYAKLENEIDSFIMLYDEDIYKILNYSKRHKIDKYNLLGIYIYIMSCINKDQANEDYLLCYPSYERIASELNIISNTINSYIKVLKELKIIYYDYAGYKETNKGKIKNSNMFYCRYKDKNILIDRVNNIALKEGYIKVNNKSKNTSNEKRSIKMKLNNLNKKGNLTEEEKKLKKELENNYKKLTKSKEKNNPL